MYCYCKEFLTTEHNVVPSNIGIKDQYMAFQWV